MMSESGKCHWEGKQAYMRDVKGLDFIYASYDLKWLLF